MRAESGGRITIGGRSAVSSAGAIGLMQLMPGTWAEMRALLGLGHDPQDPHDNILAGAAYLRSMYDRFGYPGLFAAYNAGPSRYSFYLSGTRPLPAETRAYAERIARDGGRHLAARAPETLFVSRSAGGGIDPALSPSWGPDPGGLFAVLGSDAH